MQSGTGKRNEFLYDLKARVDRDQMNNEADMAKLESGYEQAKLEYEAMPNSIGADLFHL